MPAVAFESAVYPFEGLLPELESPPIAARRALDHAGFRLPVEGWRSLPADDRQRITLAGASDRVDHDLVAGLLRRASPSAAKISPASDPDPSTPPDALVKALEPSRTIDAKRWSRLRAVDRYALAHTYRRAVARSAFSILGNALDVILALQAEPPSPPRHGSAPPPPPLAGGGHIPGHPYQPAGYYSSFVTPPHPRDAVPPEKTPTQPRAAVAAVLAEAQDPPPSAPRPLPMGDIPRGRGFATFPPPPGSISNHLNTSGEVHMVDVAKKPKTERRAIARGSVLMRPDTAARLLARDTPKGEVLATARLAGIMAAKRTHEIIPLCHMVALTHLDLAIEVDAGGHDPAVHVTATADAYDRTGCEMEAMVAVSTACLTVYDMLKGIDRDIVITDVKLMEKSGGRSGHYKRAEPKP